VHPPPSYSSYGSVSHPISMQSVSLVGAQIHCARMACPNTFHISGRPSHSRHACILAGGHRSSVELRPSRNPSLKSSETMPSWGVTPTHSTALRRCAAYVATTPPLLCIGQSVSHPISLQSVSLVGAQLHCARTRTAHTLTSQQSRLLFRSESVHFR
jgi:hypothetical protein